VKIIKQEKRVRERDAVKHQDFFLPAKSFGSSGLLQKFQLIKYHFAIKGASK
jgi:hypothetical protein